MRIATVNVSTMRDKQEEIIELMKEKKIDILGLCESRMKEEGRKTTHDDYQIIWKGRSQDHKHGVAFLLTPEMAHRVTRVNYKNERIIGLDIDLKHKKISLIQVYAPQQGRPIQERR